MFVILIQSLEINFNSYYQVMSDSIPIKQEYVPHELHLLSSEIASDCLICF